MLKSCAFLAVLLTAAISVAQENRPAVTLDKTALTLKVGETSRLTAAVKDSTAGVLWASSNPGFATVGPDGLVSAIHEGSLTVTAALPDNAAVADCKVTVVGQKAEPAASEAPRVISGIVIGNEITEMAVGDDLGIVATCLPYKVFEGNPYTLESSQSNILQVSPAHIVTAVGTGVVTVTARTPNGLADSLTFEVKPRPSEPAPTAGQTYRVELAKFGIVPDSDDPAQAWRNTLGVNQALLYAQRWGYRNVVFPRGRYVMDPADSISMRSNLRVDLDGSTWQILPNRYARYAFIRFHEMNGPNLLARFDVETKPALRKALSELPLPMFVVGEGDTSILSPSIPVGTRPENEAADQVVRGLERDAVCYASSPMGIEKTVLEQGKPAWISVRL
jgi:hypothetical protein